MSDSERRSAPIVDRQEWLQTLRRENEQQENALAPEYDALWGEIEDTHRVFVDRFLSMLPPGGSVLDAACGTGKYFAMVLDSRHSLLGVDHSGAYLVNARAKFPRVPTEKNDLQDLSYEDEFDGVMCVDAMEFVPPEDWPGVLDRFRTAVHTGGCLYVTVELALEDLVRAANEDARASGLPVVEGEVILHDPDDYYHYYPPMERVRAWLADAGFAIEEEAEEPWHEAYAYHHLLARAEAPPR